LTERIKNGKKRPTKAIKTVEKFNYIQLLDKNNQICINAG
jgi:hypothetical protein